GTNDCDVPPTPGLASYHPLPLQHATIFPYTTLFRSGGKVFLTAADAITSTAVTGTITTTGSLSAVAGADTAGAGGEVLIRHTNAAGNKTTANNPEIVGRGAAAATTPNTAGAGEGTTL